MTPLPRRRWMHSITFMTQCWLLAQQEELADMTDDRTGHAVTPLPPPNTHAHLCTCIRLVCGDTLVMLLVSETLERGVIEGWHRVQLVAIAGLPCHPQGDRRCRGIGRLDTRSVTEITCVSS